LGRVGNRDKQQRKHGRGDKQFCFARVVAASAAPSAVNAADDLQELQLSSEKEEEAVL
jgi:hypothetical protein